MQLQDETGKRALMPHVRVTENDRDLFVRAFERYRQRFPDASLASWMRMAMVREARRELEKEP